MADYQCSDVIAKQLSPLGQEYPVGKELLDWAEGSALNTLPKLFQHSVENYGDRPYLGRRVDGEYVFETYSECYAKMRDFASALLALGINPGDRVANFSNNRPEWPVVDFGCAFAGCVHVPMYATLSQMEMAFIAKDSGARVLICATEEHLAKAIAVEKECPALEHIVAVSPTKLVSSRRLWSFTELLEFGYVNLAQNEGRLQYILENLQPWDVSSLVFTSGTTGVPKGAMLMHGNFCSQAVELAPCIQANCEDVAESFLPLAHVFERALYYIMTYVGGAIGYANGIHSLIQDMQVLHPTLMASVPVLFGKVYDRFTDKIGKSRAVPYKWALKVGRSYRVAQRAGRVSQILRAKQTMARRMVFADMHRKSGGRLRYYISGGAPLRREVSEFFWDVGLPIIEGYGLTETSPVLCLNPTDAPRVGSVGKEVPLVTVRIDEEGEIIARGPNIMRGYFGRPEETAAVFDQDGWFHTGDIGHCDDEGYVTITDRIKDVLVLSNGKNVAPAQIEQVVAEADFVMRVVLVGHNRPFVSALVVPDFEKLAAWAEAEGLLGTMEELVELDQVKSMLASSVREACRDLSNYEKVKKIAILPHDFSVADGELTHSMKVKHRVVEERYAAQIEALYQ